MRLWIVLGCVAACGGGGVLSDDHVIVDGLDSTITDCRTGICQHNENTVAPIDRDRFLVTWYPSPLVFDEPWSTAIFAATDIRQATIDVSRL